MINGVHVLVIFGVLHVIHGIPYIIVMAIVNHQALIIKVAAFYIITVKYF
jgi:hypothetical protein